jgi:hypothetical protein
MAGVSPGGKAKTTDPYAGFQACSFKITELKYELRIILVVNPAFPSDWRGGEAVTWPLAST